MDSHRAFIHTSKAKSICFSKSTISECEGRAAVLLSSLFARINERMASFLNNLVLAHSVLHSEQDSQRPPPHQSLSTCPLTPSSSSSLIQHSPPQHIVQDIVEIIVPSVSPIVLRYQIHGIDEMPVHHWRRISFRKFSILCYRDQM
ncbi:hypothetical protein ACHAWU_009482 [Discostella pseudostelligera]|uniref:Uncharacterized protein n=1 Tax=Discostella pseudostelligera TaxID=259834 RepID=A0ABD3M209_9STRA